MTRSFAGIITLFITSRGSSCRQTHPWGFVEFVGQKNQTHNWFFNRMKFQKIKKKKRPMKKNMVNFYVYLIYFGEEPLVYFFRCSRVVERSSRAFRQGHMTRIFLADDPSRCMFEKAGFKVSSARRMVCKTRIMIRLSLHDSHDCI